MTPEERAAALAALERIDGQIAMDTPQTARDMETIRKALEAPVPSETLRKARAEEAAAWETYHDARDKDAVVLAYGTARAATRARGALESKIMNAALS